MATYKEQLERAQKVNQAKRELVFATLQEDEQKQIELRQTIRQNMPDDLKYDWGISWRGHKAMMPWIKVTK